MPARRPPSAPSPAAAGPPADRAPRCPRTPAACLPSRHMGLQACSLMAIGSSLAGWIRGQIVASSGSPGGLHWYSWMRQHTAARTRALKTTSPLVTRTLLRAVYDLTTNEWEPTNNPSTHAAPWKLMVHINTAGVGVNCRCYWATELRGLRPLRRCGAHALRMF